MVRRKIINDDDVMTPSHNQLYWPKVVDIGASRVFDLNHIVCRGFGLSVGGSISRVTYASTCSSRLEYLDEAFEIGRMRFSIVSSEEFLNALMRRTRGGLHFLVEFMKISSRIIEIQGAMPLPPVTITSLSCLQLA